VKYYNIKNYKHGGLVNPLNYVSENYRPRKKCCKIFVFTEILFSVPFSQ
jgi:hypothetical protein